MSERPVSTVPPVPEAWGRIEAWLSAHAPVTYATLRPPVDPEEIAAVERELGLRLPDDFVAVLTRHDGVGSRQDAFTFPGGGAPLSLAELLDGARMNLDLWDDGSEDGEDGLLDGDYWHRRYVMFTGGNTPDGLVLDCRPGDTFGAVGYFFNGEGTRFGHWSSYAELLTEVADALENGTPVGRIAKYVGVPFAGELLWEPEPQPVPEPFSLFERAAAEPAPAPAGPFDERFRPVAEEGWAGEYAEFCLTFVHGVGPDELLGRYGASPGTHAERTRVGAVEDSARWTGGHLPTVRAGRAGEWAFGIEQGHAEGARDAVLRRLSRGTRAVSLHFSGFTALSLYEDGRRVTLHDTRGVPRGSDERDPYEVFPGLPGRPGTEPPSRPGLGRPLGAAVPTPRQPLRASAPGPALRGDVSAEPAPDPRYVTVPTPPGFAGPHREVLRQVCAALTAALGIDLPPDALDGALPSALILPVLEPLTGRGGFLPESVTGLLDAAAPDTLRTALAAQLALFTAETGLDRYPEVAAALTGDGRGPVDDDSPLGIRLRTVTAERAGIVREQGKELAGHPVTWDDLHGWRRREEAAQAVRAWCERPARQAAGWILPHREDPWWRTRFTADLAGTKEHA
ncbi:SMI1/KNR4 family protein [Streptomyces sp. HUAS MG91]|uniref:SMI1/KNR4 family protein n=1 Tax=Streptomyces tabacisoli TaxID=3156398 RepID=A0AAU8INW0_9ACTN